MFPVGRLDQDTTGLLDHDERHGVRRTTSRVPSRTVPKTLSGESVVAALEDDQLDQLRRGVDASSDGLTLPAIVQRIRDSARYTFFEITITEGRNRQVRRMVEALGAKVLKLVRTRIGPIEIGDARDRKASVLTAREVGMLGDEFERKRDPSRYNGAARRSAAGLAQACRTIRLGGNFTKGSHRRPAMPRRRDDFDSALRRC